MDNLFSLIDERIEKRLYSSVYIKALPCTVLEVYENELVKVQLSSNESIYTVPNFSGSPVEVGESVQLFCKSNAVSDKTSYIGASLNKGGASLYATAINGNVFTGALFTTARKIAGISFVAHKPTVLLGFNAVVQGDATAGSGTITIHVDDVAQSYSPIVSTIASGYVHCSFVLPLTLTADTHYIEIKASGANATLTSIKAYVYGYVESAEPPYTPTTEDDYIYDGADVLYYIGSEKYIETPTTLNDVDVTTFEATSFNLSNVKAVYIPEGLERIE